MRLMEGDYKQLIYQLSDYLPHGSVRTIARWIIEFNVDFVISSERKTKLGDYSHPFGREGHKITINENLNHYEFLVTTIHEFAHLVNWEQNRSKVKPHGKEWKKNFSEMINPFIRKGIFPPDIADILQKNRQDLKANCCSDIELQIVLDKYSKIEGVYLHDLPGRSEFLFNNTRFLKLDQLRKRIMCKNLHNNRKYLFQPLARVELAC